MHGKVIEMCPHCETEIGVLWDIDTDGHGLYCPYCGNYIMLCSECPERDGELNCDWSEDGAANGKCCSWDNRSASDYKSKDKAEWIITSEPCASTLAMHCSNCGCNTNYPLNFCPDCGRKMQIAGGKGK